MASTEFIDPYLDPETGLLRNKVGARTQAHLDEAEAHLASARAAWAAARSSAASVRRPHTAAILMSVMTPSMVDEHEDVHPLRAPVSAVVPLG